MQAGSNETMLTMKLTKTWIPMTMMAAFDNTHCDNDTNSQTIAKATFNLASR